MDAGSIEITERIYQILKPVGAELEHRLLHDSETFAYLINILAQYTLHLLSPVPNSVKDYNVFV